MVQPSVSTGSMPSSSALLRTLVLTTWVAFLYVFLEWLFFATKPSFLTGLSTYSKWMTLFHAAGGLALVLGIAVLMFVGISTVVPGRPPRLMSLARRAVPSALLAMMFVLLLDNFTITVFAFGIRDADAWLRVGYALVLVVLWFAGLRLLRFEVRILSPLSRVALWITGAWLMLWLGLGFTAMRSGSVPGGLAVPGAASSAGLPNILLLASDGLDANHMSAYGYERDTTPTLQQTLSSSLVVENAFPNSAQTGASIASMLTSKLPTDTRLIVPPDILLGPDAYEHLPGILASHGYHNASISLREYADPFDLNVRSGFAFANGRSQSEYQLPSWVIRFFGVSGYFVERMVDRAGGRLAHISGIEPLPHPYAQAQGPGSFEESLRRGWGQNAFRDDLVRLNMLFDFIDAAEGPFFAHLQFFGTHGPAFPVSRRVFSAGKTQSQPWMLDFYDDAVLQFDHHYRTILEFLHSRGQLENTLIVIHSDHGREWETGARIPLIFQFPDADHAGRISENVQNLDIAPTLLDYLGIPIPAWMQGQSILASNLDPMRPILCPRMFVSREMKKYRGGERFDLPPSRQTPFKGLEAVTVTLCHLTYHVHLLTDHIDAQKVKQHTQPCSRSAPSTSQLREIVSGHLQETRFDTSTLWR